MENNNAKPHALNRSVDCQTLTLGRGGTKREYISLLNVLACQAVIILHTNGIFWSHPTGSLWITSNFLETFFYPAVPIFYMISGATLLNYRDRYNTRTFLKRRFLKTGIPFIFWSCISGMYSVLILKQSFDRNPLHIIDNIFNTRYFSIYWFFIPLFAIYLSIPILSLVPQKIEMCRYASTVGLVFIGILPLICSLVGITYNEGLTPPVVGGSIIFVFLGYYFANVELSKAKRYFIYLLGIAGWAVHFAGTIFLSAGQQEINGTFKGYTNIPSLLHSIACFVFVKELLNSSNHFSNIIASEKIGTIINRLSALTFGIYLLHFYFVCTLPMYLPINRGSLVWRIGGAIGIFWVCAFITWAIQKVPLLRKLVP